MKKLIKGTHHIALKCANVEEFGKVIDFYTNVLGLDLVREWGEGEGKGMMLTTGDCILEFFASGKTSESTGTVNHFALATDDVDECVKAAREAGFKITMEPTDIVIKASTPFPARIAFCIGPVGEEIEFFCEK